jgi:hypothetical protein
VVNSGHEYENSQLLGYLNSHGAPFKPLFDEISKSAATPALLDAYVKKVTKKSLLEQYSAFMAWVLFDAAGPLDNNAMTLPMFRALDNSAKPPYKLEATAPNTSYKMQISKRYGAKVWGFKVEGTTASRTFKVDLQPADSSSMVPANTIFGIYTLKNDTRVSGGGTLLATLTNSETSRIITVDVPNVIYVLATNAADGAGSATVSFTESAKEVTVSGGIYYDGSLDGPTGTYTISGSWEVTGTGAQKAGGFESMPYIKVKAGEPVHIQIEMPISLSKDTEQVSAVNADAGTSYAIYTYTIKEGEVPVSPQTFKANVSGKTMTADFTLTPGGQVSFAFSVTIASRIDVYDEDGNVMPAYSGDLDDWVFGITLVIITD